MRRRPLLPMVMSMVMSMVTPGRAAVVLALLLAPGLASRPASARDGAGGHSASLVAGRDCADCHTPDGWAMAGLTGAGGGFDHARTGFPLTGSHGAVPCAGCHQAKRKTERMCFGCHRDEHQGRMGLQCDQCHDARSWRSTRAIRQHRMTRLPLTGVHALLDCTSCHTRTAERTWTGVPADCFACHEKDYRASIHPVHQGSPIDASLQAFSRDCGQCHRPIAWAPAFVNPRNVFGSAIRQQRMRADHDLRFPITFGKHRGAACESCHTVQAMPRVVSCTGCHAHGLMQLQQQHGGAVATDGAACLGCHPRGAAR